MTNDFPEILRAFEEAHRNTRRLLDPRLLEILSSFADVLEDGRRAEERYRQTVAFAESVRDSNRAFAELAVSLDWPPPWHIPAALANEIAQAQARGELSPGEITSYFVSFYDQAERCGPPLRQDSSVAGSKGLLRPSG